VLAVIWNEFATGVAVMVVDATVCEALTIYVPVPPVPVSKATILVPPVTPVPDSTCPTAKLPPENAVTVRVYPEILPVVVTVASDVTSYSPAIATLLTVVSPEKITKSPVNGE
jgi:hypothetical protein